MSCFPGSPGAIVKWDNAIQTKCASCQTIYEKTCSPFSHWCTQCCTMCKKSILPQRRPDGGYVEKCEVCVIHCIGCKHEVHDDSFWCQKCCQRCGELIEHPNPNVNDDFLIAYCERCLLFPEHIKTSFIVGP